MTNEQLRADAMELIAAGDPLRELWAAIDRISSEPSLVHTNPAMMRAIGELLQAAAVASVAMGILRDEAQ